MTISEFCIRRPVFTILLMIAILVGGIVGWHNLTVSALPKVDFPTIQVTATLPGASAETMASSVATPLERQFSTIAGITSIVSTSFLGNAQITLQFDLSRNIDGAALDVQSAISATLKKLPKEMTIPPYFTKVNPAEQPVFFIVVSSDTLPLSEVDEYADTLIAQKISTISGVAQVSIYGEQKYAVRIQVNPEKLASLGIGLNEVGDVIRSAVSNTPVGEIESDKQLFNLKVSGQPGNAEGFRKLIALWRNGAPVRFQDVAVLKDSVENDKSIGHLGKKQAIVLAIQRQQDANIIEVVQKIRDLLPIFKSQIPPSIELTPLFDRSVSIKESVRDVQITLMITIALVIGVIFMFLRSVTATLIPALAVPLSIIATYGGMQLFGFSINIISLMAITLSVGFVVDDAIVMLENIIRHIEKGEKPLEAALKGAKEISFTIVSITFSLIAVFIPVLFMGGMVGRLFREFAVTISFSILISGLISLTLTPMLSSKLLKNHQPHNGSSRDMFARLTERYAKSLEYVLNHKRQGLVVIFLILFVTIFAFIKAPKGFFPLEDTGFVFTYTEAAQDISFEGMLSKQQQLAEIISQDQAVNKVYNALGGGRGPLNSGRIFFSLKPLNERDSIFRVISRINKKLAAIPGINAYMQPVQNLQINSKLTKSTYQYVLQSGNLNELNVWSTKLVAELKQDPAFINVTSDLQLKSLQANIEINQELAASQGITYDMVRQALYYAFGSAQVGTIYTASNYYSIILELLPQYRQNTDDIKNLYIKSANGNLVQLNTIARVYESNSPLAINHQGQLPAVTISFDLAQGFSLSNAIEKIKQAGQYLKLPQNIITSFQGSAQVFQDSASGQAALLLLSIVVIYIILGMLYESFIHPVTILSGLPSAGLGAIITLLICGMDISIIALIGIILLIGIVKKNSIMMIDFAITKRQEGFMPHEAITQACLIRFRPIMMTTMAAFLGSIPIAIGIGAGAEFRQPLGVAVIGGLLVSQLLTLYITPIVYLYLESFNKNWWANE